MNKQYKILKANTIEELSINVNNLIAECYKNKEVVEIVGGMVAEVYMGFPPTYYQTLIIDKGIVESVETAFNLLKQPLDIPPTCENIGDGTKAFIDEYPPYFPDITIKETIVDKKPKKAKNK